MIDSFFPPVTLIIPNFNGAQLLRLNLPSVVEAAEQYPGKCLVIVVDDSSKDNSIEVLDTGFPQVRLVRHAVNRGFSEAIRSGVEAAGTEFLIFLNSDVRPDPDFIASLIRHFERPDIFSVTPLVVDGEGRPTEESWRCYRIRRGRFQALKGRGFVPRAPIETLFASGGSMALRKSMFLELGGFLPIFKPFYSEDSDLGLRAWRRGWRSLFEPGCRVIHDHKGSSISNNIPSARVRKTRRRNQFLLEWMHVPAWDIATSLIPGYLLQALGRLAKFDRVYFAGLCAALRRLPEALRIRAEIERTSVLGFWEIMDSIERSKAEVNGREINQTGAAR
jgi:GT2 family glycosyltransferase